MKYNTLEEAIEKETSVQMRVVERQNVKTVRK